MATLIDTLHPYSKLIGVFAALIIFGSWIVANIVARHFNDLRDSITRAQDDKLRTEQIFHLESKLLEVYQVAASARRYSAEARAQDRWTFKERLNSDIEQLERIGVTRDFAYSFSSYSARTEEFVKAISPPKVLADRVRTATMAIEELRKKLDDRHDLYRKDQAQIAGEVINPNTITEDQARQLSEVIAKYREDVEFGLTPMLTPAANEMFRSYDALFGYSRDELVRRELRAKFVSRAQIALFVLGSIVALISAYLDAVAPKSP